MPEPHRLSWTLPITYLVAACAGSPHHAGGAAGNGSTIASPGLVKARSGGAALDEAIALYAAGSTDAAAVKLAPLADDEHALVARYDLATIFLEKGMYGSALELYRSVADDGSAPPELRRRVTYAVARIQERLGEANALGLEETVGHLIDVGPLDEPDVNDRVAYLAGTYHYRNRGYDDAKKRFTTIRASSPLAARAAEMIDAIRIRDDEDHRDANAAALLKDEHANEEGARYANGFALQRSEVAIVQGVAAWRDTKLASDLLDQLELDKNILESNCEASQAVAKKRGLSPFACVASPTWTAPPAPVRVAIGSLDPGGEGARPSPVADTGATPRVAAQRPAPPPVASSPPVPAPVGSAFCAAWKPYFDAVRSQDQNMKFPQTVGTGAEQAGNCIAHQRPSSLECVLVRDNVTLADTERWHDRFQDCVSGWTRIPAQFRGDQPDDEWEEPGGHLHLKLQHRLEHAAPATFSLKLVVDHHFTKAESGGALEDDSGY